MKKIILIFHNIGKNKEYSISFHKFKKIIKYFEKNRYSFCNIDEFIKSPQKKICLTFDDGYKSHLNVASYLKKKGIPGTFYITSGWIGRKNHLGKEDILKIKKKGMEIGSHSHTHRNMTKLKEKEINEEITKSKNILEEIIKSKVNTLSLPGGEYNKKILNLCKKKYKTVRTSDPEEWEKNFRNILPGIGVRNRIPIFLLNKKRFFNILAFLKKISRSKKLNKKIQGIFHMHTTFSDGKQTISQFRKKALNNKINFLVITDHLHDLGKDDLKKMEEECKKYSDKKLKIVPGIEVNCETDNHIIVIDPKNEPPKTEKNLIKWAKKNKKMLVAAHADVNQYPQELNNIEIWNAKKNKGFIKFSDLIKINKLIKINPNTVFFCGADLHDWKNKKIYFRFEKNQINKSFLNSFQREKLVYHNNKFGLDSEGNLYGPKVRIILSSIYSQIEHSLRNKLRKVVLLKKIYNFLN